MLIIDEIAADHGAREIQGDGAHGLVDHTELGSQLRRGPRIDRAQHPLPEAATGRQQRIVGNQVVAICGGRRDPRARQVAVDLTAGRRQYLPELRNMGRVLA